jgi:hypothetical protein
VVRYELPQGADGKLQKAHHPLGTYEHQNLRDVAGNLIGTPDEERPAEFAEKTLDDAPFESEFTLLGWRAMGVCFRLLQQFFDSCGNFLTRLSVLAVASGPSGAGAERF